MAECSARRSRNPEVPSSRPALVTRGICFAAVPSSTPYQVGAFNHVMFDLDYLLIKLFKWSACNYVDTVNIKYFIFTYFSKNVSFD